MKTKVAFLFLLVLLCVAGCENSFFGIRGTGPVVTQAISIGELSAINMTISADVYFIKGDVQYIEIEAQQNIIDNIERDVDNGMWEIEFDKRVYTHEPVKIYITTPHIEEIIISGSGDIFTEDMFESDEIELIISGSGDIDFAAKSLVTNITISGSGDIYLNGETNVQDIIISGSGNYNAYDYLSTETEVSIPGSGNCRVNVSDMLDVDISGSGSVFYRGYPTIRTSISGSGSVIDSN